MPVSCMLTFSTWFSNYKDKKQQGLHSKRSPPPTRAAKGHAPCHTLSQKWFKDCRLRADIRAITAVPVGAAGHVHAAWS